MSERPTDHAWEALVEVTNANVAHERGALNRALSMIKTEMAEFEITDEQVAQVIRHQAGLYREVFPEMPLTPNALAKWWGKLEAEAERLRDLAAEKTAELEARRKTKGVNLSARSNCVTCGGDHWVSVSFRPPVQTAWMAEHKIEPTSHPSDRGMEETAPCPVCNLDPPVMKNFWDGRSWGYGPEPGEVVIV